MIQAAPPQLILHRCLFYIFIIAFKVEFEVITEYVNNLLPSLPFILLGACPYIDPFQEADHLFYAGDPMFQIIFAADYFSDHLHLLI